MRGFIVAVLMSVPVPAFAQSSLGITGASFSLGAFEDQAGVSQVEGAASVDVAITEYHGFQGDLRFSDTMSGGVGSIGGHLFMTPREGQKYGLFAQLSDVDGRALTWGVIGAEGIVSLGDTTTLEIQGGLGAADDGLDFIHASVATAFEVNSAFEIELALDVADYDEAVFRATSYDVGLTARYSPEGAPWGLYASVNHSGFAGRDGQPDATSIGFGITVNFGNAGGVDARSRHFRTVDPVVPLLRRGLW